jgi:glycosyltransferase involved in cell wall biosynthesis
LPDCLESVRGRVDEIVVADTGSTDSSVEVAKVFGAKVVAIPWENDFAKARNLSLAEVTSDWVLMLDADECLDPEAEATLPRLLADAAVAGYQVTIRNYVRSLANKIWDRSAKPNFSTYAPAARYPAFIDHENVRLFRRDPEIYFSGRVHETVGWQSRRRIAKLALRNC